MIIGRGGSVLVRAAWAAVALTAFAAASAAAQDAPLPLEPPLVRGSSTSSESPAAGEPQASASADNPVWRFFARTQVIGFVDTYYSYNFNTPKTPCSVSAGVSIFNCLHAFDVAADGFSLNLVEVALEKRPTSDSRVGYRLDLDVGAGAALVATFEPGGAGRIYRTVQQAYVSYLAPAGNGSLQIDLGKFVTPVGFEVIESKDNWNYSRSLLFTLAIPRYHQGVRVAYRPTDQTRVTAFLVNGWNDSKENNGAKSVGVQFFAKPRPAITVTANYIGGPEIPDDDRDWRHLLDIVATASVRPGVTAAINYDKGKELSTHWQGAAAYLRYQPNAWFALTPRYELFNDHDGWALIGQPVRELTLTAEFKAKQRILMRVEYRGDATLDPFFVKDTGEQVKAQKALTVAWVYSFSTGKSR